MQHLFLEGIIDPQIVTVSGSCLLFPGISSLFSLVMIALFNRFEDINHLLSSKTWL